jgi:glutamate dehydrogenase
VDCSDHEVNIKILLDGAIAAGELEGDERSRVLEEAALPVELAVLDNNARQALALSLAERHSTSYPEEYARFIRHLEREQLLDRRADAIPTDDELRERALRQQPLTRPELATLLSYAKIELEANLRVGQIVPGGLFLRYMANTFPGARLERLAGARQRHPLANEIICTRAANEVVDHLGPTFVHRLSECVGCSPLDVVTAYTAIAAIFDLPARWDAVEAAGADAATQFSILLDLLRLGRAATRWLARRHRGDLDADALDRRYRALVRDLAGADAQRFLSDTERERREACVRQLIDAGVTREVAEANALAPVLVPALPIADAVHDLGVGLEPVVEAFAAAGARLGIGRLAAQMAEVQVAGHWQFMERDTLQDDLTTIQMTITRDIVKDGGWERWQETNQRFHEAFAATLGPGLATGEDLAHAAMLVHRLQDQMPMLEPAG